jgi:TRAP-type C4-dicarboxylate transport system permease small subunit
MNNVKTVFLKFDRVVGIVLRVICIGSLVGIFVLYIANVFIRFVPVINFTVTDEIVEMLTGWLIFFGAAELQRENKHFQLDFLVQKVKNRIPGKIIKVIVYVLSMVFICVLFYYGFDLFNRSTSVSTTLRIPKRLFYVCVPVSAAIMGGYLTRDIAVMFLSLRKHRGKNK